MRARVGTGEHEARQAMELQQEKQQRAAALPTHSRPPERDPTLGRLESVSKWGLASGGRADPGGENGFRSFQQFACAPCCASAYCTQDYLKISYERNTQCSRFYTVPQIPTPRLPNSSFTGASGPAHNRRPWEACAGERRTLHAASRSLFAEMAITPPPPLPPSPLPPSASASPPPLPPRVPPPWPPRMQHRHRARPSRSPSRRGTDASA